MSLRLRVRYGAGALAMRIPREATKKAAGDALALHGRAPGEEVLADLIRTQVVGDEPETVDLDTDGPAADGYVIRYGIALLALALLLGRSDTFARAAALLDDPDGEVSIEIREGAMVVEWGVGMARTVQLCRFDRESAVKDRPH